MAVLQWLHDARLSVWIRESDTIWAYPTILTLHTFGMGLLVGPATVINLLVLGIGPQKQLTAVRPLFGLMWAGFFLNAMTGMILFAAQATTRGTPLFLTKLLFVFLALVTTLAIKRRVTDEPFIEAPHPNLKLLASVSLCTWTAAVIAGRLLAYGL